MEVKASSNRIHPLVAAASVSVILASLVGVGAMTGLIPNSHSSAPSATAEAVPAPVLAQTSAAEPTTANSLTATSEEKPKNANAIDTATVKRSASASQPQKSYAPQPVRTAQAPSYTPDYREPVRAQAPAICYECGRVESVNAVHTQAAPSGVGMIAGGIVGGLLGNQVGGGNGKKVATVAGAVGGGYAGHEIEKRTRSTTTYEVRVRMEDGRIRTFPYNNQPHWSSGDRVRVVDGYLKARA
ncbi:MAG: glycine zipper 2TM domain-containing protein [Burkholderiaceae bacterium]